MATTTTLGMRKPVGADQVDVSTDIATNMQTIDDLLTGASTHASLKPTLESGVTINNPARTFKYTLTAAAIAAARTLNLPLITGTDTLMTLGLAQTVTGILTLATPVLTKPTVNASVQGTQTYTPAAAGTATLDLSLANVNLITMPAGNITIALSSGSTGQAFTVHITQDGVGSRTVTWFATIRWAGGSAPTLTTTLDKRDVFGFIVTGANTYDGFIVGQNL